MTGKLEVHISIKCSYDLHRPLRRFSKISQYKSAMSAMSLKQIVTIDATLVHYFIDIISAKLGWIMLSCSQKDDDENAFPIEILCNLWPPMVAILNFLFALKSQHLLTPYRNICTKFHTNPFSGSWEEIFQRLTNLKLQSHVAAMLLTNQYQLNNWWQKLTLAFCPVG